MERIGPRSVEPAPLACERRCSGSSGRQYGLRRDRRGRLLNPPGRHLRQWSVELLVGLRHRPSICAGRAVERLAATTLPNVLAAGTYGRGIWQIPLWTSGTQLTTASDATKLTGFWGSACWNNKQRSNNHRHQYRGNRLAVTSIIRNRELQRDRQLREQRCERGSSCAIQVSFHARPDWKHDWSTHDQCKCLRRADCRFRFRVAGSSSGLVTASPGTLSFGQVQIGTTSPPLPVTVENPGNTAIPSHQRQRNPHSYWLLMLAAPRSRRIAIARCR